MSPRGRAYCPGQKKGMPLPADVKAILESARLRDGTRDTAKACSVAESTFRRYLYGDNVMPEIHARICAYAYAWEQSRLNRISAQANARLVH